MRRQEQSRNEILAVLFVMMLATLVLGKCNSDHHNTCRYNAEDYVEFDIQ